MTFAKRALEHTAGEVREASVHLILELYRIKSEAVRSHLPSEDDHKTLKNPLYHKIFDGMDKVDGKPTKAEKKVCTSQKPILFEKFTNYRDDRDLSLFFLFDQSLYNHVSRWLKEILLCNFYLFNCLSVLAVAHVRKWLTPRPMFFAKLLLFFIQYLKAKAQSDKASEKKRKQAEIEELQQQLADLRAATLAQGKNVRLFQSLFE